MSEIRASWPTSQGVCPPLDKWTKNLVRLCIPWSDSLVIMISGTSVTWIRWQSFRALHAVRAISIQCFNRSITQPVITVSAQRIAHVLQKLVNCWKNISTHRRRRELQFFLFVRSWAGERFRVLTNVKTKKDFVWNAFELPYKKLSIFR
jgi:hypothetical protein